MNQESSILPSRVVVIPVIPALNHLALDLARHHEGVLAIYCTQALKGNSGAQLISGLSQNHLIDLIYLITSGSRNELESIASFPAGPKVKILSLRQGTPLRETIEKFSTELSSHHSEGSNEDRTSLRVLIAGLRDVWGSDSAPFEELSQLLSDQASASLSIDDEESDADLFDRDIIVDFSSQCNCAMNQAAGGYISLREVEDLKERSVKEIADLISASIQEFLTSNPEQHRISTLY